MNDNNREATMNKTAEIAFAAGVAVVAFASNASAQNSKAQAAIDTSLRGAVERKEVPGVVALVTDRKGVRPGEASTVWDGLVCAPVTAVGSWREVDGVGGGGGAKPVLPEYRALGLYP